VNDLERLTAIEDIRTVKARYFRLMDTKDWDGLEVVFAPDAVFDLREMTSVRDPLTGTWSAPFGGEDQVFRGRDTVMAMVRGALAPLVSVHHGHMPEIEIQSETTAAGIWAMEDVVTRPDGELVLHGRGHYHDTYERLDTGWTIKTTRITRLKLELGPNPSG
jgi:SnoaL-like domain